MKRKWLLAIPVIYFSPLVVAQTNPCDWVSQSDHSQGVVCHAPLRTVVPPGVSTITAWEFVPETPQNPGHCPLVAQADKTFSICGKQINGKNVFTFDFGDGSGYNPMPPGPQGIPGTNGTNGTAATITVGSQVTTLPAGSPATVTNAGTNLNAILNFGIPQGPPGNIALPATLVLTCARGKGTVQLGYVSVCVLSKPLGTRRKASK